MEYSIHNILAASLDKSDYAVGIDLQKLQNILSRIDYAMIRRRRITYNLLHQEFDILDEFGIGVSFRDVFFLLAYHNLITNREALTFVISFNKLLFSLNFICSSSKWDWRSLDSLLANVIEIRRVQSLLRMMRPRQRFLAFREQQEACKFTV